MRRIYYTVENAYAEVLSKEFDTYTDARKELKRLVNEDRKLGYPEDELEGYEVYKYEE